MNSREQINLTNIRTNQNLLSIPILNLENNLLSNPINREYRINQSNNNHLNLVNNIHQPLDNGPHAALGRGTELGDELGGYVAGVEAAVRLLLGGEFLRESVHSGIRAGDEGVFHPDRRGKGKDPFYPSDHLQRLGIAQHIVNIRLTVNHVFIKQNRDPPPADIAVWQVHRRFAGQLIVEFHR